MDYARYLFSFKGRINRARYLVIQLALLTIWFLFWVKAPFQQAEIWGLLAAAAMIWINLATTAKRLHDRNRSGWWAIAVVVVNRLSLLYYGLFFGLSFGVDISIAQELLLVMGTVGLSILQTWIVIELFFLVGTEGANRFGPDPARTAAKPLGVSQVQSFGVPDFLLHRAGPAPRS
jgi:uncharacterized membrane protein YhaH (DUF805 family)